MPAPILLVEDDEDLVATMTEILADHGLEVAAAASGEAALALAARRPATIAFVDLHLDGGLCPAEVFEGLRAALPAGARVYLLSGERGLEAHAQRLGADGFLEKPFGVDALLRVVAVAAPEALAP